MNESLPLGKHTFSSLWKTSKIWLAGKSLSNCANLINLNKGKYEVLHQEQNNPVQQETLGANRLESSLAEKCLDVLEDKKMNVSQQSTLQQTPVMCRAVLGRLLPAGWEVVVALCSVLMGCIWSSASSLGSSSTREILTNWTRLGRGTESW